VDRRQIYTTSVLYQMNFTPQILFLPVGDSYAEELAEQWATVALQVYDTNPDVSTAFLREVKKFYPEYSDQRIARDCHVSSKVVKSWKRTNTRSILAVPLRAHWSNLLWTNIWRTNHPDHDDTDFLCYRAQFLTEVVQRMTD